MLTQEIIERFYYDVERLGLKRPVSAIAEKTGYTKGNVSSYLSKKLSPSEKFIKKFYEVFNIVPETTAAKVILSQKNNAATENISGGTIQERYIRLLEQNDQFFKTQYHNLLISLNTIIAQGQKSEVLLKLNLQHVGAIEALQRGLEPDVVQEQINNQIASLSPDDNTDNDGGT
jgi:transcriptional regulator with XRE-family HTH domain